MTLAQALKQAAARLQAASDSAGRDADVLLCHVLGQPLSHLRTHPERALAADAQQRFDRLIARRAAGEPVAYLVGEREFWSQPFEVSADTLIPRPETELLVEEALRRLDRAAVLELVDLGTGSGIIALSLAKERPRWRLTATDASLAALRMAEKNARRLHCANVRFRHGSWFEPLEGQRFDAIVSNPPYIAAGDPHLSLGDLRFEPASALVSGADGLDDLREIIAGALHHLRPQGMLLFEHGYDQGERLRALLQAAGFSQEETVRDLAGQERVTLGVAPPLA
jgi:release factor glutamine methyltransferase